MAKKKAAPKKEQEPTLELVEIEYPKPADPDLATITYKDLDGKVCQDIIRASETRRKIRTIGSRKFPDEKSQARMDAQVALWNFWLECFGEAGEPRPEEAPVDRKEKPAPRARSTEELTP